MDTYQKAGVILLALLMIALAGVIGFPYDLVFLALTFIGPYLAIRYVEGKKPKVK